MNNLSYYTYPTKKTSIKQKVDKALGIGQKLELRSLKIDTPGMCQQILWKLIE